MAGAGEFRYNYTGPCYAVTLVRFFETRCVLHPFQVWPWRWGRRKHRPSALARVGTTDHGEFFGVPLSNVCTFEIENIFHDISFRFQHIIILVQCTSAGDYHVRRHLTAICS